MSLYSLRTSLPNLNQNNLITLDQQLTPFQWSQTTWQQTLENPSEDLKIYVLDDYKGFILFSHQKDEDTIHLLKIVVDRHLRGAGVGKILFSKLIDYANKLNVPNVYLEVSCNNTIAYNFYLHLGFKTLRREKSYYSNGDDAWKMSLSLFDSNSRILNS